MGTATLNIPASMIIAPLSELTPIGLPATAALEGPRVSRKVRVASAGKSEKNSNTVCRVP
jgi:hypothetical protein